VPDPSAREAYDEWHRRYAVDAEADTPWHRLVRRHLDWGRDMAGRHVLEIGAGRGGFACWLARQPAPPAALVAEDFARSAVTAGRQFAVANGVGPVRWAVGDIQNVAHPAHAFDTVISCETVEHVPDPRRAFAELGRVLRPGGRLFLTTPNYLGPMGLYRMYLRVRGRRYTEEGQPINNVMLLPLTVRWIRQAGLRVLTVDATGHYIPFPGAPPREYPALGRPHVIMRWFALHSLVIATKPPI